MRKLRDRISAAILALTMFITVWLPGEMQVQAVSQSWADKTAQTLAETGESKEQLKVCVISDTHYYPLNYVSDCEDYQTYVGGDPKMLAESGSIVDAALGMIKADAPDLVLISGDLTKDGELKGHEDLAARLHDLEKTTDTEVFVINGNHDIYNYQDSCTFENGKKEQAQTTTPDDFKRIYAEFGYNGEYDAQYYVPREGKQAGGLSYSVTFGNYAIIGIDSGRYSPDADTGMDTNEHITAGRIDPDLLPWLKERIKEAKENGKTVIGLMHHGLLPHFSKEAELLSEYVVSDWQEMAGELADAGMRYIFTGHMHANDIAEYTSVNGNKIYDLETGSLAAYGSPVRTVTITREASLPENGTLRLDETFHVKSKSVDSITYDGQVINNFQDYTMKKLYPETLFNNMAAGMLKPEIQKIANTGIRNYLKEAVPELDIDATVLDAVRENLAGGMNLELGSGIGRVAVSYRNGAIELRPTGTAGLIGPMTISDAQVIRVVDDLLAKVENQYLKNPEYLLGKIDGIVTKVSKYGVANLDEGEKTLYDFVALLLTGHYAGGENPPTWVVETALPYMKSGKIIEDLIKLLLEDAEGIINDVTANLYINTGIAFSGLWKTAIDSQTNNGQISTILTAFNLDVKTLLEGLISEYMSESFLTGMGGLIDDYASSMLFDTTGSDDILNDENGRSITWSSETPVTPQAPSVANGLAPTQIAMTQGETPDVRYIRWYTGKNAVGTAVVELSESADFKGVREFEAEAVEVVKPKPLLNLGLVTTYTTQKAKKYTAKLTGLEEGKTYYYRVGTRGTEAFSTPVSFTVKNAETSGFTFINVNDSQGMIQSDYETYLATLEQAKQQFSGAAFVLHAGDFVDDGSNEDYWTWALDGISPSVSYIPAAGNHEARSEVEGVTDPNAIVSHFQIQNQDIPEQDTGTGIYYSYTYENATFIILNTNDVTEDGYLSEKQYNWAYDKAKDAETDWVIVLMHKSPYSNGPHGEDKDVKAIRKQMNTLTAECGVDLVLSGHDHVYNRTPYLSQGKTQNITTKTTSYQGVNYTTAINPVGTVFVIAGTAGVKNYTQKQISAVPSEVTFQQTCPVYAGITIDGGKLYYRAYKVQDGVSTLVDSFAIDKSGETETPAWKKVVDLIGKLPKAESLSLENKAQVEEARAAYDALSQEEQKQVANLNLLLQAEKMIAALTNVSGKETVHVNSKAAFVSALNNSNVGTIITDGAEIEFETINWLLQAKENTYDITRDLVIRGSSKLTFVMFRVKNGATLILDDTLSIDDTRAQGSVYASLNPVEVYRDSALITRGNVSMRTEYGTGGTEQGICVKLMESGSKAILGSKGSYWGAEGSVYSSQSGTEIIINDGTYERKNNSHRAVDSAGIIEVNGGTIRNLWCSGKLSIYGGTFDNGSVLNPQIPVDIQGTAYMTGGTVVPYNGKAVNLRSSGRLHILTNTVGQLNLGGTQPWVSSVETMNYRDISVRYNNINGSGSSDGIYQADRQANTVEALATIAGTKLPDSTAADGRMKASVGEGDWNVYGKYYLAGGGKTAPEVFQVEEGGEAIVYGPTRYIENHRVERAVIEGDETRLARYQKDGILHLNGYTLPANAFDNAVKWSSDKENVAQVSNAGNVTMKSPGTAVITMTSRSNPTISDFTKLLIVNPEIKGEEKLGQGATTAEYTLELNTEDLSPNDRRRIRVEWSVDDLNVARINKDTGELEKIGSGFVTVTAQLLFNGVATDIRVSKNVAIMEMVSVDISWGALEYTYNAGIWNRDTHKYEGAHWAPASEDADHIKVQNNGEGKVTAQFSYQPESAFNSIDGNFWKGAEPGTSWLLLPDTDGEKLDVCLKLDGSLKRSTEQQKIGNVTVRIEKAEE